MKDLLIIGCGGHARSVIDVINENAEWQIKGLIGLKEEVGKSVMDYPIIGDDLYLSKLRKNFDNVFLAIGKIGLDNRREKILKKLEFLDFTFPSVISKYSIISRYSVIGEGTFIGHNVVVNVNAKIGKNCILNTRSIVEHDSVIGENCHLSTGAIINGGVKIGHNSFIGSNSVIRENLTIPANTIISSGKRIMGWPLREEE
tara:strand:+ start:33169 stop:33771 length:603 start_codon:yes stop_codon:yes gene_type:complete